MNITASHVVEWSDSKHSFRIRTLPEFVASNVRQFFQESGCEFAPLGFFDTNEEATRFMEMRKSFRGNN
ncbi:hypothetical protein ACXR0O_06920 [Verrucomicrobiota bacterium sgz303538]